MTNTFEAFFHKEYPMMVALAAAVSGSRSGAEDIAQEAMTRAYRHWGKVKTYDKPGAWLRRVTINLAISARSRAGREVKLMFRLVSLPSLVESPPIHDDVWEAVRQLPKNQRAVVALYYLEDMSVAEIAEILGCAESTARVHLHRGRASLSKALEVDDER